MEKLDYPINPQLLKQLMRPLPPFAIILLSLFVSLERNSPPKTG
jgi:hypothetical protein